MVLDACQKVVMSSLKSPLLRAADLLAASCLRWLASAGQRRPSGRNANFTGLPASATINSNSGTGTD
jgi:hypothetical protein